MNAILLSRIKNEGISNWPGLRTRLDGHQSSVCLFAQFRIGELIVAIEVLLDQIWYLHIIILNYPLLFSFHSSFLKTYSSLSRYDLGSISLFLSLIYFCKKTKQWFFLQFYQRPRVYFARFAIFVSLAVQLSTDFNRRAYVISKGCNHRSSAGVAKDTLKKSSWVMEVLPNAT